MYIKRLNDHIDMLVDTLEQVAKDLLILVKDANKRYYFLTSPDQYKS
jgi:hypothetical protein